MPEVLWKCLHCDRRFSEENLDTVFAAKSAYRCPHCRSSAMACIDGPDSEAKARADLKAREALEEEASEREERRRQRENFDVSYHYLT